MSLSVLPLKGKVHDNMILLTLKKILLKTMILIYGCVLNQSPFGVVEWKVSQVKTHMIDNEAMTKIRTRKKKNNSSI